MTVALTGTNGLFTRLGKIAYALNSANSFRGTATLTAASIKSIGPATTAIDGEYGDNQQLIDGLYSARDSVRNAMTGWTTYLRSLAQNTLIQMVVDDARPQSRDLTTCLKELIRQMTAASADINRPTVSVVLGGTAGSNEGDGVCIFSVVDPALGVQRDYVFNETLTLTCTTDAQSGGTEGREVFSVKGQTSQPNQLMWDWERGSGASISYTVIDATTTSSQILENGDFEDFTTNAPDDWTIVTGSAGTTIDDAGSSDAYKGSNALKFVGNGSELTNITQDISDDLEPLTAYAVNAWIKVDDVPAGGVLEFALIDGSNNILQDAAGTDCKLQIDLTQMTTSYQATGSLSVGTEIVTGTSPWWRTPAELPSTVKFRVRLSTALENTKVVFVDQLAFTPGTQIYAGGPYMAMFSGAAKFIKNDRFTAAVSNNYGGAFARFVERVFDLRQKGLRIPSDTSPSINDNLIA